MSLAYQSNEKESTMKEKNNSIPEISIVCPCFNEEKVIDQFMININAVLNEINKPFEIIFINDGSTDSTFDKLLLVKNNYRHVRIINFSRNFGKEAALSAGLEKSLGNVIIPIDADLQHPPELIKEFILKWKEGYEVVVARRQGRKTEGIAKRLTGTLFYRFTNKISDINIPESVGDYRLMTRKVVNAVKALPENQRFMKGLFAWVGFKTAIVDYEVEVRYAGKTSFTGWKLWNFALDGIASFSTVPLRIWFYIGIMISSVSFIYGSFIIIKTLFLGIDTPGYASTMTTVLFLGGVQLIGIGVLGEYIGRIYLESKRRPTYIIEDEF